MTGTCRKKKRELRAGEGLGLRGRVARWEVLPVFLLKNKLPSNPLSNEGPREQGGEEMATRLHKLLGKA